MILFSIPQIKPSWPELFVATDPNVLSGLHIVDIAAMPFCDLNYSWRHIRDRLHYIRALALLCWNKNLF
ncbi:unnamed protein product [Hymenolepis diminuta]|uniref:Uncharacterized protein n=1 Tax=Hymenolepis diminuta TaxID=6216 RepID=A0A564YCG8_HYMDI|nr:unnamed protein product [Hymenolepis diminuta]